MLNIFEFRTLNESLPEKGKKFAIIRKGLMFQGIEARKENMENIYTVVLSKQDKCTFSVYCYGDVLWAYFDELSKFLEQE